MRKAGRIASLSYTTVSSQLRSIPGSPITWVCQHQSLITPTWTNLQSDVRVEVRTYLLHLDGVCVGYPQPHGSPGVHDICKTRHHLTCSRQPLQTGSVSERASKTGQTCLKSRMQNKFLLQSDGIYVLYLQQNIEESQPYQAEQNSPHLRTSNDLRIMQHR